MIHDTGGDKAYHMLYPMIMDARALYLVVYDHRKYTPQSYMLAIGQWLDLIQIHAPGAVVKIIGTQCDQVLVKRSLFKDLMRRGAIVPRKFCISWDSHSITLLPMNDVGRGCNSWDFNLHLS